MEFEDIGISIFFYVFDMLDEIHCSQVLFVLQQ